MVVAFLINVIEKSSVMMKFKRGIYRSVKGSTIGESRTVFTNVVQNGTILERIGWHFQESQAAAERTSLSVQWCQQLSKSFSENRTPSFPSRRSLLRYGYVVWTSISCGLQLYRCIELISVATNRNTMPIAPYPVPSSIPMNPLLVKRQLNIRTLETWKSPRADEIPHCCFGTVREDFFIALDWRFCTLSPPICSLRIYRSSFQCPVKTCSQLFLLPNGRKYHDSKDAAVLQRMCLIRPTGMFAKHYPPQWKHDFAYWVKFHVTPDWPPFILVPPFATFLFCVVGLTLENVHQKFQIHFPHRSINEKTLSWQRRYFPPER